MNIEIRTTTVKLSRSIIGQMSQAAPSYLHDCEVLGYVVNIVKDASKALLLRREGKYYVFPCNWQKSQSSIYRKIGKWTVNREFESPEDCNLFWVAYQSALGSAEQIYI